MQMFEPSHSFYRLDYGNALLYSITLSIINCLYRMQNSDAHQVTCTHKGRYNAIFSSRNALLQV